MRRMLEDHQIIETGHAPEYFSHGTRRMELLNGDMVCLWHCMDEPTDRNGLSHYSRLVAKLYVPLKCFLWNKTATGLWLYNRGLTQIAPPVPPEPRLPNVTDAPRTLM